MSQLHLNEEKLHSLFRHIIYITTQIDPFFIIQNSGTLHLRCEEREYSYAYCAEICLKITVH